MIVRVRVRTNQPKFSIKKDDVWAISLRSSPEKNKANQELVKELSKLYKKIRIVSGFKSRSKIIEVE